MKNIWKKLFSVTAMVTMMAMLVACPEPGKNGGGDDAVDYFVAGIDGDKWANDSDAGTAIKMDRNGKVYTLKITATSDSVTPYGFKITTKDGWNDQIVTEDLEAKTTVDFGTEVKVRAATKVFLEEKDEDGNAKYEDDNTKIYISSKYVEGEEYTFTFDSKAMTVKVEGKAGEEARPDTAHFLPDYGLVINGVFTGWEAVEMTQDGTTYTAEVTITQEHLDNTDNPNLPFGILNDDWGYKFTGAELTLSTEGVATWGAEVNNKVTDLTVPGDYIITVVAKEGDTTVKVTVAAVGCPDDPDD